MRVSCLLVASILTGCYTARSAAPDINAAWRGRARIDVETRIGAPTQQAQQPDGTIALRWVGHGINVRELPSGHLSVKLTSTSFSIDAAARPGVVERTEFTRALAVVAPTGAILDFDGAFAAGFPSGLNVRTGLVMGLAGGLGGFSNATTPMPSLNLYLGGMIGPRSALIGTYSFINAKDPDAGYAMGHAWGFGLQYWPAARLAVRASAAAVIDLDPGLDDATFAPGGVVGVGYALVRSGSFVLDARFDAVVSTSATFGMVGVGVNVN
jgi:hypothetical protein